MENAWQLFLRQLGSTDPEFTYDDVCAWSADEYACLMKTGLIFEIASATRVICDACPEAHWETVRWTVDGKRPLVACPTAGTLDVNPERLRRWRASPERFATLLAQALSPSKTAQSVPASRLWFLGQHRIAGSRPHCFFAAIEPEELQTAMKDARRAYGPITSMLLVPFSPPDVAEDGKVRIVDLGTVSSLQKGRLIADLALIEEQFTGTRSDPQQSLLSPKSKGVLKGHRLGILRAYMERNNLDDMHALGRHVGASADALYAMTRSDSKKFGEVKLMKVLEKISCTRAKWDRVSESATPA